MSRIRQWSRNNILAVSNHFLERQGLYKRGQVAPHYASSSCMTLLIRESTLVAKERYVIARYAAPLASAFRDLHRRLAPGEQVQGQTEIQ